MFLKALVTRCSVKWTYTGTLVALVKITFLNNITRHCAKNISKIGELLSYIFLSHDDIHFLVETTCMGFLVVKSR